MIKSIKDHYLLCALLLVLSSCQKEVLPKPTGYLSLEHTDPTYKKIVSTCPYEFEIPANTVFLTNDKCWAKIKYPKINAVVNVTYRPVKNNLRELFLESEKLTTKHSIKADQIGYSPLYENPEDKVYGRMSNVIGDSASPIQFHITDSVKHFITGSLYFNVQPNYDSLYPSIRHIEKDIKLLIETTKWRNK